jgi:predicted dehydrogenase
MNTSSVRWGLIGPGAIAQQFAKAVAAMDSAALVAVHGRDVARSQAFAARHAPQARVHSELHALLADPQVDMVYIATPHSAHADAVQLALLAGKGVLCEKPLVPTAAQARSLIALAQARGVFLMEALWSRCLPSWQQARAWLAADAIGAPQAVQSSFCFNVPFDAHSRLFDPALAGGALLDIGVYNLSASQWLIQREPLAFHVQGVKASTGVEQRVAATLDYGDGVIAQFVCAFDGVADNRLRVFGPRGHIELGPGFWQATEATLVRPGQPAQHVPCPFRINGFEYQIEHAQQCWREGAVQSPLVPHQDSLAVLTLIDAMRQRLGVRYPFE